MLMKNNNTYKARFSIRKTHKDLFAGLTHIIPAIIVLVIFFTSPPLEYEDDFPRWLRPITESVVPLVCLTSILFGIDDIGNSFATIQIVPNGIVYHCPLHKKHFLKWDEIMSIRLASVLSSDGSLPNYEDIIIISRKRGELNILGRDKVHNQKEKRDIYKQTISYYLSLISGIKKQ